MNIFGPLAAWRLSDSANKHMKMALNPSANGREGMELCELVFLRSSSFTVKLLSSYLIAVLKGGRRRRLCKPF